MTSSLANYPTNNCTKVGGNPVPILSKP